EYVEPDVPLTALPTDDFADAIDAVTPVNESDWRMGSPMEAVLEASFIAVDDLRAARPHDDAFILLITDGMPALCDSEQSDVEPSVAVVSEQGNAPIYIVGVRDPV